MRVQRVAVMIAAAVGLGLFAVGCGPTPGSGGTDTGKGDSSKTGQPSVKATGGGDKTKALADKAKTAADDLNKDLDPLKKAIEAMKEKVTTAKKDAGSDANKLLAATKLEEAKDEAEKLVKEAGDKIGGLAGQKDDASLDGAVKATKESIDKAKTKLKDYMSK